MINLFHLFLSFLQIGLFSIGGGYAAMPLIQHQTVDIYAWLTLSEFTDLVTIAEMTPGPIAINSATFVGMQIAGLPGAVVAVLGCILPSCIIASTLSFIYYKYRNISTLQIILSGLRPAIVALIAGAGLTILHLVANNATAFSLETLNWIGLGLFAVAFFVLRKFKLNPIIVMACCGLVNLILNIPSLI